MARGASGPGGAVRAWARRQHACGVRSASRAGERARGGGLGAGARICGARMVKMSVYFSSRKGFGRPPSRKITWAERGMPGRGRRGAGAWAGRAVGRAPARVSGARWRARPRGAGMPGSTDRAGSTGCRNVGLARARARRTGVAEGTGGQKQGLWRCARKERRAAGRRRWGRGGAGRDKARRSHQAWGRAGPRGRARACEGPNTRVLGPGKVRDARATRRAGVVAGSWWVSAGRTTECPTGWVLSFAFRP